jgi:hypothetical protein
MLRRKDVRGYVAALLRVRDSEEPGDMEQVFLVHT